MNVIKNAAIKSLKTFKWLFIVVISYTIIVFISQGGAAAAEKLVGLGIISILFTALKFIYTLVTSLFANKNNGVDLDGKN